MLNRKEEVICLQCPLACRIIVEVDRNKQIVSIANNQCVRGVTYAEEEIVNPLRVLATTVRIHSRDQLHPLLPVITKGPIPKGLLREAMLVLAETEVEAPVKYNDVVYANILNTGVDVVATMEVV